MSELIDTIEKLAEPPANARTEAQLNELLKKARAEKRKMLGFERLAEKQLDIEIGRLERQKQCLSDGFADYRKFTTLEMLGWRDGKGRPKIALFSPESPTFEIAGSESWFDNHLRQYYGHTSYWVEPYMPPELYAFYRGIAEKFSRKCRRAFGPGKITLSCQYTGVIPDATRKRIETAKKQFEQVYIMAEATNWAYNEEPKPVVADPLVVGWDGEDLWLVDRFDLTPIERLLAVEFTE